MNTFRYVCGITLGATTETRIQNAAAQAIVHHGRSASGVDECGVSYWNPGRFDQLWTHMVRKRKLSTWMGILKTKLPMRVDDGLCECRHSRRKARGPPSPGIAWCQWYHLNPAYVILIWAQLYMFHILEWLLINACNNEDYAKIWTPCIFHAWRLCQYGVSHCSLVRFTMFCLKCIWMPEMCPAPRWIGYPAPRSPADSFVMAGPIRHGLLRACFIA